MRAQFFSSIAHELRTPLNSIIPILKLVLDMILKANGNFSTLNVATVQRFIQLVHSSSIHLQNVVNDAIDVSRFENNKFEINNKAFNIRDAIDDVHGIMKFQLDAKNLAFNLKFND